MRRKGISMVALVITIIVLIVLTSAVVITGIGAPKQAQLATFYSNIDTVQELVSIQMGDNMITATLYGYGDNYKWVDILDGCNENNWQVSGVVAFGPMVTGLDKDVARISLTLLEKTSLPVEERSKYYVDDKGVVYYEGFVYEEQTLYTKATIIGDNDTPEIVINPMDGQFNNNKNVNSPKLLDGMVGIYWDNGVEVYSHINGENADYTRANANENFDYDQWYDYVDTTNNANTSKWANAKTADGSYWVWIPRYAYSITSGYHGQGLNYTGSGTSYKTTEAGTIEIEFLKGTTNIGTTGKNSWDNASGANNWNIHPAFTVEDTELAGIWVAKYEMSDAGGNVPVSKPGVSSWRYISIGNCFTTSFNYNRNIESHLMKNIEWGAVAYLAHSKYGRNATEVTKNTSSNYTAGGYGATALTYKNQSTTGNEYGILDMAGGSWEYVAGYITKDVESTKRTTNGGDLLNSEYSKYVEVYDVGTEIDYGKIGGNINYGDSVYEISERCFTNDNESSYTGWYSDRSTFLTSENPFFIRGCYYGDGTDIGIFAFSGYEGIALSNITFRVVLWGSLN